MTVEEIIKKLNLVPLPEEGGYYRETFRDFGVIPGSALPLHGGERSYSTCSYYLITQEQCSGLHVVKSAEIFHHYAGDPVRMIQMDEKGNLSEIILGSDFMNGESPQVVVPPYIWQGTKLLPSGEWALLGCTVAPGFEFEDFKGATFDELSTQFPQHENLIRDYTHS